METTPFDLTPEQKGMLAALSRETGKPIPALIAAALKELQEHERAGHPHGERQAGDAFPADARQRERPRPFWQRFLEASRRIPDEELDQLPPDLAAQVDHYIYGTPKELLAALSAAGPYLRQEAVRARRGLTR
jgi:hypothetical protein